MNESSAQGKIRDTFITTHWTRVLEARGKSPEAKEALSELCAAYYAPVSAYIRNHTVDEEAARDLTQEFFQRLLARQGIDSVDPNRGRFRSFLLGAVKHFLSDARDFSKRVKRGGGEPMESLDAASDTALAIQVADPNRRSPEREFDRKWALTVLDRALATLAEEHRLAGKTDQFEALKPWLTGDAEGVSQAEAAGALGLNEGAVKVAVHRLRRRFRDVLKVEIGRTLNDPGQIQNELACLVAALAET
jgi:RNA polymerase sigma-70 factor (ECF subfamily)